MGTFIDLTGLIFGRLTVISRAKNQGKRTYWLCRCECGKYKEIWGSNLQGKITKSCGCDQEKFWKNKTNLTGQRFGRLLVVCLTKRKENRPKEVCWECLCSCGNMTMVCTTDLRSGNTQSCGC